MNKQILTVLTVLLSFTVANVAEARVYRNKKVGHYNSSYHLADHKGQSLLSFMKKELYPAIKGEASSRSRDSHVRSIANGEGVELRLADDVSTYHVKYKQKGEDKAERSGRSFGAVGTGTRVRYLADASYKHYLSTLESALEDENEAPLFYEAILKILINSDPSGIDKLGTDSKRVAADFVAVYIAEQYRRMIKKDGKALARSPEWDNAHLHVTLLGNFHAGQANPGMYYHGRYTTEVYHQIERSKSIGELCAYRDKKNPKISLLDKRDFNLTDYWQFNAECERSGVNITRRDFVKMSGKVTQYLNKQDMTDELEAIYTLTDQNVKTRRNVNDSLVDYIVSDKAPNVYTDADALVDAIVGYLMVVRTNANQITDSL